MVHGQDATTGPQDVKPLLERGTRTEQRPDDIAIAYDVHASERDRRIHRVANAKFGSVALVARAGTLGSDQTTVGEHALRQIDACDAMGQIREQ